MVHNYTNVNGENHHVASNKNKTYTSKFKEIADMFGLNLNGDWNIIPNMKDHHGRHCNNYHEFVLSQMKIFADEADSVDDFLDMFNQFKEILDTPEYRGMMYSAFWKGY